jgi:putative intracellular protease/amidase
MPLPTYGFDPTEVAIPWKILSEGGIEVVFTTPGGHDKGVKEYLESDLIQKLVVDFFKAGKPVAAICHGVVVAARSTDPKTGKSVIHDFTTTALLKSQELAAYNLTRLWMGDYYLTYPGTTVEDEVKSAMSDHEKFVQGPTPVLRDSMNHLDRGFVVQDRNYLSARWPGDVYSLTVELLKKMESDSVLPH